MSENIVVIGGAGFIGSKLVQQLDAQGHSLTVVSRSAGSRPSRDSVRYLSAEVANAERLSEIISGAQVVFDLSSSLGLSWADYERDYIGGTTNVAEACLQHGVRRLIYTSSISALFLDTGKPVTEADGTDPLPLQRGFYSRGKVEAERVLMRFHTSKKLPVVILRPGIVLGPGGFLTHGALGDVSGSYILGYGSGTSPLPCVLAEDVASALVLAKDVSSIEGMAFNLAGDIQPTAQEYVAEIRRRSRRDFQFIPRGTASIIAGDISRFLLKALVRRGNNIMGYSRDTKSLSMSSYLDCSLAKQKLGWRPCTDREEFYRQALDSNLPVIASTDLRLQPSFRPQH